MNALSYRSFDLRNSLLPTLLTLFLVLLASMPAAALDEEETVLVSPGAEFVEVNLPAGITLGQIHGPFHGDLFPIQGGLRFEPSDSFWEVGSDITQIQSIRGANTLQIRWVAGGTALDGPVVAMSDPGFGQWTPWQLIDSPENEIEVVPGLLGQGAYLFNYNPIFLQELKGVVQDPAGSGGNTTTTSDFQVVIDDIDVELQRIRYQVATFYEVKEGPIPVFDLETRWNDGLDRWQIRLVTVAEPETHWADLDADINDVRLVRWTEGPRAGTQMFVNETRTHSLDTPAHVPVAAEVHRLLMEEYSSDATSLQLRFEEPTVHTSGTLTELAPPTLEESFNDGLGSWVENGVLPALGTEPQTLPGTGQQFVVDLDAMNPLQSSYLYRGVAKNSGIEVDGHGFRFWLDPSELTLSQGTSMSVMVGCHVSGPCSQLRTRIDQLATGFQLVTTANNGLGSVATITTPLGNLPVQVEIRFRNAGFAGSNDGWVELWMNGVLAGRADGLRNHHQRIAQYRLGALGIPGGASGEVAFDAFEAWRFD